jgi:phospholipid transport system substrate-binding protein
MPQTFAQPRFTRSPVTALRLMALGLVVALTAALTAPAQAASPAEHFVQINIDKGLGILSNKALNDTQKRTEFRNLLLGLASLDRTARFTLGRAVHTASPHDVAAFTDAFRNYAITVYQSRLSAYSGQSLKVTGSTERAPGDFVVSTVLVDPNGAGDKQPIEVDFRVDKAGGTFKVLDVSVVGVWLAIEERDQFTAFLAQHNNSVSALTRHLNELTARLQTSGGGHDGQASSQ